MSDNPRKKSLRILSTAAAAAAADDDDDDNLERIPLMGFGTYPTSHLQCFEWCWISSFRSCGKLQKLAARKTGTFASSCASNGGWTRNRKKRYLDHNEDSSPID